MTQFRIASNQIVKALGLKWLPIACKFSEGVDLGGDRDEKLSVCEALDVVRREKKIVNLSLRNCACAGGLHFLGMKSMDIKSLGEIMVKHRAFETVEAALNSLGKQPQPAKRGIVFTLGPLTKFDADPDLVIFFVNAAQADRILGLAFFKGAEPFTYYPVSNICSAITNCLGRQKPEINFISTFERKSRKWSPNELIIALPWKLFEFASENIPSSVYGTAKV